MVSLTKDESGDRRVPLPVRLKLAFSAGGAGRRAAVAPSAGRRGSHGPPRIARPPSPRGPARSPLRSAPRSSTTSAGARRTARRRPRRTGPGRARWPATAGSRTGRPRRASSPGVMSAPATTAEPSTATTPYSKSSRTRSTKSSPPGTATSNPASGLNTSAGDRSPRCSPTATVTLAPPSRTTGRSAWCAKRGSACRSASGSAIHSCSPCSTEGRPAADSSEWAIPRPAVIRFSSPGRISCRLPRLSRCSTKPWNSQLTVCRPICGCGGTCIPGPRLTSSGP